MTRQRYSELMSGLHAKLTPEELAQGYHFCCEWDGLLISPEDMEARFCDCEREDGSRFVSQEQKQILDKIYEEENKTFNPEDL
jgi:hypothetical protein